MNRPFSIIGGGQVNSLLSFPSHICFHPKNKTKGSTNSFFFLFPFCRLKQRTLHLSNTHTSRWCEDLTAPRFMKAKTKRSQSQKQWTRNKPKIPRKITSGSRPNLMLTNRAKCQFCLISTISTQVCPFPFPSLSPHLLTPHSKIGKHAPLYKVLTKILETFIPMWERVLTDLVHPRPRRYAPGEWYKEEEEKDEKDEEVHNSFRCIYRPLSTYLLQLFCLLTPSSLLFFFFFFFLGR